LSLCRTWDVMLLLGLELPISAPGVQDAEIRLPGVRCRPCRLPSRRRGCCRTRADRAIVRLGTRLTRWYEGCRADARPGNAGPSLVPLWPFGASRRRMTWRLFFAVPAHGRKFMHYGPGESSRG